MVPVNISNRLVRRTWWLALIAIAIVSLALVALPVWIIQPFRPQSLQGLEWSFAMRRWAKFVTPITLLLAVALTWWIWRSSSRWWSKALLPVVLISMLGAVWFSRQNHFEWMFNPLPNAAYAKIADAEFVDDSDVVLAVESNGEAAAYPVRLMAYHHLVHDVVGGTPIVATY